MTDRATAETARLAYFEQVLETDIEWSFEIPLLLLKLEYFRRFQLDAQIAFYHQRGAKHAVSARKTLLFGSIAAGIAAVSAGAAGVFGILNPALTALGGIGVLGTALAAFASAREAMNQDRRNAERYQRTSRALEQLKVNLSDVRRAAITGVADVVALFVSAVHDQLSVEHRQWIESGKAGAVALTQMEQVLAEHRKKSRD